MSLQAHPIPPVPESTAATAKAAFPRGNRYMMMRDELGVFYRDEEFAELFALRGRPGESPWRLALVLVFQYVEGLSDAQAAEAVRSRIDWKYALSLELEDSGFDASVLSEFRTRLVAGNRETQLLESMIEHFKAAGYIKSRGRIRTDSTHVLAAIRSLNRLMCVGETVRHALNVLAVTVPEWLKPHLVPEWTERYAARFDEYRLPQSQTERTALATQIGADGRRLLEQIYDAQSPAWLRQIPAVETLRQLWLQQYQMAADSSALEWRAEESLPPAARRIASPYDVEARYSAKRSTTWVGYKADVTESCDDDHPHLILHIHTPAATTPDFAAPPLIHAALAAQALLPAEHYLDAGYTDGGLLAHSRSEHQIEVVGLVAPDHCWQARTPDAFAVHSFTLDWEQKKATCPQGHTSRKWSLTHDHHHNPIINIRFAPQDCYACPQRQRCTRSPDGPRHITVRPQAQHEALQARRREQQTAEFKRRYNRRAGVEGTLSQALRTADLRHARYIGRAKTHLQHVLTAAALNLRRIVDWLTDAPTAQTRTARFVLLAHAST